MGTAKSQGFDLAVNMRPVDGLSLSAALGYNETTFQETTPAFKDGDYVPGTGAPWVVRLSFDYSRPVADDVELYTRGDIVYNSQPRLIGSVDPGSPSYNPLDGAAPDQTVVNARVGAAFKDIDLSIYANNLLNNDEPQGRSYTRRTVLFTESYMRPRTIGISASYRY
jgi:outer membrane receptor protein involved in Fe transport